ncbi:MAG TPA: bifunctional methionine sulfoxide reductase B/A protein [Aquella sp.]|nr:bifunctional methionine sulfoxide reductase B/A protein [Aquella sp.]
MLKTNSLTPYERAIICDKDTEHPGTGRYTDYDDEGTYLCRNCGLAMFRSKHKFHSGCGWPSFDNEVTGNVKREMDKDGRRTEILCNRCNAHLGHVFNNEGYTPLDTRHCVNSASLDFVNNTDVNDTEEAILAAGCFWGVEYYLKQLNGVLKTEVGYSGGTKLNPTYKEVCNGNTGHLEVIRVIYDPKQVSYVDVLKRFFEIHDFTQTNGQGPDLGEQYLSAIFYFNDEQHNIAKQIIKLLTDKGYKVATSLKKVATFWPAEDYHQDYYAVTQKEPYCHAWHKIF